VNFDPAKWARAFKTAGAKYVIYTAKHHDGFCLFDTKFTDFKVTDKGCPFANNPRANLAKEVFSACRKEGLAVGAYFSKPDWSSTNFWWPNYPPFDRNPNYDITKHMDRWRTFVNYTHDQINELISDYGPLDILWLDGCWVRPLASINKQVAEFCKYPHDLDIDVKSIAANAHAKQPGILIVDRWVPGEFENYLTPEQKTPDKALEVPWESCISMGGAWGYVPNDNYKSARELIQLLVRIVAKGGNLLLGIGSDGRGEFPPAVYERLAEMGRWLDSNGDAIYNTMPVEPFQEGSIAYTAKGDHTVFAIYLPEKGEKELPAEVTIKTSLKGALNISLPAFHEELKSENSSHGLKVFIPATLRKTLAGQPAVVIRLESASR
jgi:alpha-L-fucosidase